MTQASCISFSRHTPDMPTPAEMMRIYEALGSMMLRLGAAPNWFSAWDGIGRGSYKKFGGAFHKKVLECEMVGYQSLGFAAAPAGSKAPGYDSFVTVGFTFLPEIGKIDVTLVANEPYLLFGCAACDNIVAELAHLRQWDYGFGFARDVATEPEIYLSGGGSNLHSVEDERRIDLWYESGHDFYKGVEPPRRLVMVRDIFPYNIIGPGHLAHRLPDGRTLREFIEADADSELNPLADNLWLWKVNADRTEAMRENLRGTGIIIAE